MMTMNLAEMIAAEALLEVVKGYAGKEMPEGWYKLILCETCKGELFEVAANYLCEVGLLKPTILANFAPALVLA
jgi:hypothetical protein